MNELIDNFDPNKVVCTNLGGNDNFRLTTYTARMNLLQRLAVLAFLSFAGCTPGDQRNDVVLDTGLPITDNMRAYDVDRYTLRHEILIPQKSIAGSATISFDVLERMDVL